jgi:hypothetical protein
LVLAVTGGFAACGQMSKNVSAPDGGSGAAVGSGGQAGTSQIMGGTGGSLGGATNGGSGGVGGIGGVNAGSSGHVEPYFHPGTRLKPRVFRAGDLEVIDVDTDVVDGIDPGSQWYDVMTGDRCLFRVGADGIERCLPGSLVFQEESEASPLSYLDAACMRPALRGPLPTCEGPHYVTVQPLSGCNYGTYRIGAARASNTVLYGNTGGSCRRIPASTGAGDVFPLEEVPPETFVAVKRVSRPRHPQMNALVREGDDGSSEIVGFFDPARGAPCFGPGPYASPQVCMPGWIETASNFSDASCMQQVGLSGAPRCIARTATALLERGAPPSSCPVTYPINGLWETAGVRSIPVFTKTNGVCESGSTALVQTRGAPIDLASLPRLDLIEVGNGPLKLAFYGFGGMPFFPAARGGNAPHPGPFVDVARGEHCQLNIFADGMWRCVPSSFPAVMDFHLFYDSKDCTGTPAYDPFEFGVGCRETPVRGVIVQTLYGYQCEKSILVSDTLELDAGPGAPVMLSPRDGEGCRSTSSLSSDRYLLRPTKLLNPADVFVPMVRELKN